MKMTQLLAAGLPGVVTATPAAAQVDILSPDQGLMIWTLIVFFIVLYLLGKFAFPHILGAVEAREQRIRDLMAEAEKDRAAAAALMEEQKEELAATRAQTQEILTESRESAERTRGELLAETRQQQEEMLARSRREVEEQVARAMAELRRDTVVIAMAAAEKLVEKNMDDEQNRRVVERYLASLDSSAAPATTAGV